MRFLFDIIINNIMNKCLKSFLCGKKYLTCDIEKAYNYFYQSIKIIENIKKNNPSDYDIILDEIEIECYKYLPINLFNFIEKGNINILKKISNIDFKVYNEDGLTPLHYAIDYGDISFIKYAIQLGYSIDETTQSGYTLLEYACIKKDPNIISFLIDNGANMKKYIDFRKYNKFINNGNSIDIILILKNILNTKNIINNNEDNYLEWIFDFIDPNTILDIKYNISDNNNILFKDLICKLYILLNKFLLESRETYINIIKEELQFDLLNNQLRCPNNKIELILYYLVPFINYKFNLNLIWLNNYFN